MYILNCAWKEFEAEIFKGLKVIVIMQYALFLA